MSGHVFISHSNKDKARADAVRAYLEARANVPEDAGSWHKVVRQVRDLATFARALDREVLADSLDALAARLDPESPEGGPGTAANPPRSAGTPARRKSKAAPKPGPRSRRKRG